MTRTLAQGIAWGKANAVSPATGKNWDQSCAAFVFWCMGAQRAYGTAALAMAASGGRNPSRNIPAGGIAWFHYGTAGHVAFSVGGGQIAMASRYANNWGAYRGTMTIAQYENASGAEYAGYTMRFGPSSFAKPLVVPKPVVTPPVTIPVPTPPLGASDRIPHGGVLAADKALYAGDYKLDVQADGNLVIRKWDSVTGTWKVTKNFLTNLRSALKRVVKGTQWLSVGTDDHVVLYGKNAKGERQVIYTFPWPLPHNRGAYFQLDSKGNLVTRAASGEWIWHLK